MMNKGLEVIEARWLFDALPEQIQVVIHPQSIVHSMVEYSDGSVLAQLGNPDMRTPIAQALAFPDRIESGVPSLDFFNSRALTFEPPDFGRFAALKLAYEVLSSDGSASTVFNAANEVAVASFLQCGLPFTQITAVIAESLARIPVVPLHDLETVIEADRVGRATANDVIEELLVK
jgi:1-deoxy-D-xylulose-5-phosphate reductoisomerase